MLYLKTNQKTKKMNKLQIKEVDINSLIGAEYNPRILKENQFEQLKNSIQRFGFVEPIIVNINKERKNIIISGHARLNVEKYLKIKKVPIVEIDLTPEKEKELNIRMNKNGGEWDFDMLANGEFEIEMLLDSGFENWELSLGENNEFDEFGDIKKGFDEINEEIKKSIKIEFDSEDFEPAKEILKFWKQQKAPIGKMILEYLKNEKNEIDSI